MKYLSEILEEQQTALFKECGVFFAFNKDQLDEGLAKIDATVDDVVNMGGGMVCLEKHAITFIEKHDELVKNAIQTDLKMHGKAGVIRRELFNHEAFYTYDIESTVDALDGYGITEQEVLTSFNKIAPTVDH